MVAGLQVLLELQLVEHGIALGALRPQTLGHDVLAAVLA